MKFKKSKTKKKTPPSILAFRSGFVVSGAIVANFLMVQQSFNYEPLMFALGSGLMWGLFEYSRLTKLNLPSHLLREKKGERRTLVFP